MGVDPPQPGGRAAAPGDVGLLQAFLNSHFDLVTDRGADLLATRTRARQWLSAQGLLTPGARITPADLDRLRGVREGLRGLIAVGQDTGVKPSAPEAHASNDPLAINEHLTINGHLTINDHLRGAAIELRFTALGPELVPVGTSGVDRALGKLTAIVARAMIEGSWRRLKICPGPHCGWVFYDHSRNGSGRWCSMNVCGGREKARAHYRRRRGS